MKEKLGDEEIKSIQEGVETANQVCVEIFNNSETAREDGVFVCDPFYLLGFASAVLELTASRLAQYSETYYGIDSRYPRKENHEASREWILSISEGLRPGLGLGQNLEFPGNSNPN